MNSRLAELFAAYCAIAFGCFLGFTSVSLAREVMGNDGRGFFEAGTASGMAASGLAIAAGVTERRYKAKWGVRR